MPSYEMDRARWAELDIYEQMGNISSEVGRAINATRAGKARRARGAIERALDLMDATAEVLAAKKAPALKEVLRAREEFLKLFYEGTFEKDADNIERYFSWFATVARGRAERGAAA